MSILSEVGAFFGQKMGELKLLVDTKIGSQTDQDIEITDSSKGVILNSPSGDKYRLRITDDKKLVVDDINSNETHIAEMQLVPSGSSNTNNTGGPITWDG